MHSALNFMEQQKLYRVEEFETSGWTVLYSSLPKNEAQNLYEGLLSEGISPKRIRIVREQ